MLGKEMRRRMRWRKEQQGKKTRICGNDLGEGAERTWDLDVKHVEAHRTEKEQKPCRRTVVQGNEKADDWRGRTATTAFAIKQARKDMLWSMRRVFVCRSRNAKTTGQKSAMIKEERANALDVVSAVNGAKFLERAVAQVVEKEVRMSLKSGATVTMDE